MQMLKKLRQKTGQSTLEYIILFAVVIMALVYFLPSTFKDRVEDSWDNATNAMVNMSTRIKYPNK
jgi:hypothetical protein